MKTTVLSIKTERGIFGVIANGDNTKPLIIFLHGFPDNYKTSEKISLKFAEAGFYSVSMAIRGFSPSPLTGSLKQHDRALDLLAVAEKLSPNNKFIAIGHDIGGQTIYRASMVSPEKILAAIVLAAPHPNIIQQNSRSLKQLWRSRYIFLMQLGKFAEWWVSRNNYIYIEKLWNRWSPDFKFPITHINSVKKTFQESMPSPVFSYRTGKFKFPKEMISVPTLLLMGENDGCVLPTLAQGQEQLFKNKYEFICLKSCGHFLHIEKPDEIYFEINKFINDL